MHCFHAPRGGTIGANVARLVVKNNTNELCWYSVRRHPRCKSYSFILKLHYKWSVSIHLGGALEVHTLPVYLYKSILLQPFETPRGGTPGAEIALLLVKINTDAPFRCTSRTHPRCNSCSLACKNQHKWSFPDTSRSHARCKSSWFACKNQYQCNVLLHLEALTARKLLVPLEHVYECIAFTHIEEALMRQLLLVYL